MEESKTHFGQIPLSTVKKIVKEFPEKNAIESDSERTETHQEARSPRESWIEVARKVQSEQDPTKMNALAKQLLAILNQEIKQRQG